MPHKSISRRGLVKAGLGAGAAGLLLPKSTLPVLAQDHPALGTYPAGTSGSSIFIGGVFPLTVEFVGDECRYTSFNPSGVAQYCGATSSTT